MAIMVWPHKLLKPAECRAYINPFTRSGGRTLGGVKPSYRTDLGYWAIDFVNVALVSTAQKRAWDALDTYLGGSSGLVAVPAWAMDSAPFESGQEESALYVPHSDDTTFSDGTEYEQGAISVVTVGVTAIGATQISMRIIKAAADLSGVRFSYGHALYKTGRAVSVEGDVWTLEVSPSIRELIPAGADLEFDRPTCLCSLAEDNGMKRAINADRVEMVSVSFVEATDYWNRLAAGLI